MHADVLTSCCPLPFSVHKQLIIEQNDISSNNYLVSNNGLLQKSTTISGESFNTVNVIK